MFRSSNKKKQDILEKGQQLFWKHGFKRVTIEEVCAEADVSKMTFYKFFSNKMDLVRSIMEHVLEYSIKAFEDIMGKDIPFSEKVELQIKMKMEGTADISKEFMDDLMVHADPEVMQMMQEMSQKTFGLVYESYVKAQQDGHIRQDIKPEFIMYFLNHMFEMISDEQLVKMYDSTGEMATELVRFFFYGIMGGNGKNQ